MNTEETSCCFTGHRPAKLPWGQDENDARCTALKAEIASALDAAYGCGYRHFISGMAMGCDMYFAEAVIALRRRCPEVTLEAAIPCATQTERWGEKSRSRYNALIDACDKVTLLQDSYTRDCMMRRNRYMVEHSSLIIAVFDGRPGGTMNTLLYARRRGVKSYIIEL